MHLALPGCLRKPPVSYGTTADTGGHIAYVLQAALAQAVHPDIESVRIFTRRFEEPGLDPIHAQARETIAERVEIVRLDCGPSGYLEKSELVPHLDAYAAALKTHLAQSVVPDVIHCHFSDAVTVAKSLRESLHIPIVFTPHSLGRDKCAFAGDSPSENRSRIVRETNAIEHADALIVSSRDEAEHQIGAYAVSEPPAMTVIVPGAPDLPPGVAARGERHVRRWFAVPDRPLFIAIARPVKRKNLALLVEAFGGSSRLRQEANLVILAGQHHSPLCSEEEADQLAGLRAAIDKSSMQGVIAMPPDHDTAMIADLFAYIGQSGGGLINVALHEPFGLTLLEAAQAGIAVVATKNGGPVDIIGEIGHGILVDPTNADAITAACLLLVDDPALRETFVQAARRYSARSRWQDYATRSIALYRDLIVQNGSANPDGKDQTCPGVLAAS